MLTCDLAIVVNSLESFHFARKDALDVSGVIDLSIHVGDLKRILYH